jgi:Pyruvate/2-oxoacid:ferredoxin oxidoreductase delta subunit
MSSNIYEFINKLKLKEEQSFTEYRVDRLYAGEDPVKMKNKHKKHAARLNNLFKQFKINTMVVQPHNNVFTCHLCFPYCLSSSFTILFYELRLLKGTEGTKNISKLWYLNYTSNAGCITSIIELQNAFCFLHLQQLEKTKCEN